ncbi:TBC1 domain family member 23-like isoform X1 [Montipora capricornis]|uniref:TBC1 domain family member 23-like isoform X1 n=1 Tax=Montipora capricornis TaxID=246305 RepID=UPI0035F176C1
MSDPRAFKNTCVLYMISFRHTDLVLALSKQKDVDRLRELCRGRKIPAENRADVWKVCLNVVGKPDALSSWDGLLDLQEQDCIRDDCRKQATKLRLPEDEAEEVARDMEGIITFYCKSRNEKYHSTSGLTEVLAPFMTLELPMNDVYNCFYALLYKYIPRNCVRDGKPFHLFRLLLQYHDPELCSFLESKKLWPDMYCQRWLRSLFVVACESEVLRAIWDLYLLEADPFLVFFLMLVMVINGRDTLFEMEHENKTELLETISSIPLQLEEDDIEDLCSLAQYYASRTPQSFRKDYYNQLFGIKTINSNSLSQALCLPVSISELVEVNQSGKKDGVRFFVVDCRPADQYNSGHLPTAFHLDANLMLQAPSEFATAANALFATQQQSIEAGSAASGEHLCFMGSGREEEDQYVHMVIANFLQKKSKYVSIACGGYLALHDLLSDDLSSGLADHSPSTCIVCNPEAFSDTDGLQELSREEKSPVDHRGGLVSMLSSAIKSGTHVREKLGKYIAESHQPVERHVSDKDKQSKLYRNVQPVFSIDDEDEGDNYSTSSEEETRKEAINIKTWLHRKDVISSYRCHQIVRNGQLVQSYILLTAVQLFILREIPKRDGWAHIQNRHHLTSIVKITSKRKHPDLITFKYGTCDGENIEVLETERYIIPNASKATQKIKESILELNGQQ